MRQLACLLAGCVLGAGMLFLAQMSDRVALGEQPISISRLGKVAAALPYKIEHPEVRVEVRSRTVRVGEAIRVSVSNGLDQRIFTDSNRVDCSIVMLERWTGDA